MDMPNQQHFLDQQLFQAAGNQDINLVKDLLAQGANPDSESFNISHPLHEAASSGDLQIVTALVDANAKLNKKDYCGHTPLGLAALNGHTALVFYLVEKGAKLDILDQSNATLLHHACHSCNVETVKLVRSYQKEVDINVKDILGDTPLHTVSWSQAQEAQLVAQFLLHQGTNIEAKNKKGHTPLHEASFHGAAKMVFYLLQKGANKYQPDNQGKTPLDFAIDKLLSVDDSSDGVGSTDSEEEAVLLNEKKETVFSFLAFMSNEEINDAKNKYNVADFHDVVEEFNINNLAKKMAETVSLKETTIVVPYCPAFSSQSKDLVMKKAVQLEGFEINNKDKKAPRG